MEAIDCIVPAAGRSERMGDWKPLLAFRASTIIETVVRTSLEGAARVILVTGFRGGELADRFAGEPRVTVAPNPDWALGMFSSIRRGVERVTTERFFIAMGDMPFVEPAVFAALAACPPADIVFPVHAGRRGHPVLVDGRMREAIRSAGPHATMRELAWSWSVGEISWPDDTVLRDVDTPEDYTAIPGE